MIWNYLNDLVHRNPIDIHQRQDVLIDYIDFDNKAKIFQEKNLEMGK